MMIQENVSVVIPTMNRLNTLKETLDSYISSERLPAQIVIVDQTDDEQLRKQIKEKIECYGNKVEVTYFYQDSPSSTKARNIGISLCKNDVIVFSDDDITVQKDTIKNVMQIMRNQQIAMIAGINSRAGFSNSKLGYLFGKKSYVKRNIGHVTSAMYGRFPQHRVIGSIDTEWAMGFFFVIRKSLADKWNIHWDENLTSYAYAEDLDFSFSYYKHAKSEHLNCILDERVIVEHRVSQEWRVPSRKSTMMMVLNREYLSYKHKMGLKSRIMTRWSNIGELFFRLVKKMGVRDLIDAQLVCDRHRNELANGKINPEWYK